MAPKDNEAVDAAMAAEEDQTKKGALEELSENYDADIDLAPE